MSDCRLYLISPPHLSAKNFIIPLRAALPVVPIPLRAADEDGQVNLQDVLHRAYDGPGYERFIYAGAPEPPLSAEDAEWAGQFVPQPD